MHLVHENEFHVHTWLDTQLPLVQELLMLRMYPLTVDCLSALLYQSPNAATPKILVIVDMSLGSEYGT
jgi:hypothetical protein